MFFFYRTFGPGSRFQEMCGMFLGFSSLCLWFEFVAFGFLFRSAYGLSLWDSILIRICLWLCLSLSVYSEFGFEFVRVL